MKGKTIFITGASSGIGEACARKFAANGCRLMLNARSVEKLEALKAQLQKEYGTEVLLLPFDVRDRQVAEQMIASLPGDFSDIDVLVNNAGLALGLDKQHEADLDQYMTMIDTNVKALLVITRQVVPGMLRRGSGHIINIGSCAGDITYAGASVYCATKAAVKALSDGLRIDLVDTPLRVTNVKPGLVNTNFSTVRFGGDRARADKVYEGVADKVYEGVQSLTGDDIAEVVYFAASAPAHVQIAEVLVYATNQASPTLVYRQPS